MKTPAYATVIELALEMKSKTILLFTGNILEPYDNFFTADQQFLLRESISHIQSLIVRQLNGEFIGPENTNISRNNSSVFLYAPRGGDMTAAFKFPYPTRSRLGSTKMFNYFLFTAYSGIARETDYEIPNQHTLSVGNYGEMPLGVKTSNSGLLQKLNSVIVLYNQLSRSGEITVEKEGEYFIVRNKQKTTFRYSPEDLFSPPVLQSGQVRMGFIPKSIWSMTHSSFANAGYGIFAFVAASIVQLTPLVDGLWNYLFMLLAIFVTIKGTMGLAITFMNRQYQKDLKQDIDRLNIPETAVEVREDKYGEKAEAALMQVGFVERLSQVRDELAEREAYKRFTQLAKTLIQESEYKRDLFEQLTPLFHLYLPAIQESLTQLAVTSGATERDSLLLELDETMVAVNSWLSGIQTNNKISIVKDLQKVRQHIAVSGNEVPDFPPLSLSK